MRRNLFFTTMSNSHQQYSKTTTAEEAPPRQFHMTEARDPTITISENNPRQPAPRTLHDLLARSTQPIFSVSTMFRMKAGSGCGSCGH